MANNIRLSQCMIVKNEEKRIRQALSWGRDIVHEQIVVDTGSTDDTVRLARELGAKVAFFTWCDDFSAAKNYALSLAEGDWIAFLDADEYFSEEDAGKLPRILAEAEAEHLPPDILRAAWVQLGDSGETLGIGSQDRLFRNAERIRYRNPIHEVLDSTDGKALVYKDLTKELSIMHTGYAPSVTEETGKSQRNISMLEKEVSLDPQNYMAWGYLADAYALGQRYEEAMKAAENVMENGLDINPIRVEEAFSQWFQCAGLLKDPGLLDKAYHYYERFCKTGLKNPDVEFMFGWYLAVLEQQEDGIFLLEQALQTLNHYPTKSALKLPGCLMQVYGYLIWAFRQCGNRQKQVYYATLALRLNRYHEEVLLDLLSCLKEDSHTTAEQTLDFLGRLYDYSSLKDKLFVIKSAKLTAYEEVEQRLRMLLTEEELAWLDGEDGPAFSI